MQPCIKVIAHGSTYEVTFDQFVKGEIQDDEMAATIAQRMLDGDDPYQWNADDPRFYTEFVILDRDVLTIANTATPSEVSA